MRRFFLVMVLALSCQLVYTDSSWAKFTIKWDSISYMTGYMVEDSLAGREDYEIIPIYISFNKEINTWLRKKGIKRFSGRIEVQLEPFISPVISPDNNIEMGVSVGLMYILPWGRRIKPYLRCGIGPGYTTQHTSKQATQWNFFSSASVGIIVSFFKDIDILLEYRVRHFSNAGIKKPNKGINHEGWLIGFRRRF